MATTTVEVERKYEGPRVRRPLFDGLRGVRVPGAPDRQQLSAVYYDTADLRLLRAGVTLRRRTGGHDAGWHLKLPAGTDRRSEIAVPPGRSTDAVPAELSDLVLAHSRGADLVPCARIDTRRRRWLLRGDDAAEPGEPLVEVVDDEVTASDLDPTMRRPAESWHEIEVELGTGRRRLLVDLERRLNATGARPADAASKLARALRHRLPATSEPARPRSAPSAGELVVAYLRRQAGELVAADVRLRRGDGAGVHDMRVAARRLRHTLRSFSLVVRRDRTRTLTGELHWLTGMLGEARDAQVVHRHLARATRRTPPDLVLGPVAAELTRRLSGPQERAVAAALDALRTPRYLALLDALNELLATPPLTRRAGGPAARVLPSPVRREYRRLRRAAERAESAPAGRRRDEALHGVRKAARRVRYATEVTRPAFGKPADRYARRLAKLQALLGDHQDGVVERAALRTLGAQVHLDGSNGFTFGLLHGRSTATARDLRRRYPARLRKVSRAKARRWLHA